MAAEHALLGQPTGEEASHGAVLLREAAPTSPVEDGDPSRRTVESQQEGALIVVATQCSEASEQPIRMAGPVGAGSSSLLERAVPRVEQERP